MRGRMKFNRPLSQADADMLICRSYQFQRESHFSAEFMSITVRADYQKNPLSRAADYRRASEKQVKVLLISQPAKQ